MDDIKTPPRVPANEVPAPQTPPAPNPPTNQDQPRKTAKLLLPAKAVGAHLHKHWVYFKGLNLSRKQWALVIGGLLILLAAAGFGGYKLYRKLTYNEPTVQVQKQQEAVPAPTTEASNLTGVQVPIGTNKRPVTSVMIENSLDARPQAGLRDAGIVFEAIAEGGITRFLALFQESQPDYIGPVRSARPYYLDWALAFDASYAHVGGSPRALAEIKILPVKDLDQFANAGAYERVASRIAPHNVYTSTAKLDALNQAKGFTASQFTPWLRKDDSPLATPNATSIDIGISGPLYNVHYDYDPSTNLYNRSEGGSHHTDEKSGLQIAPKTVIALATDYSLESDGYHSEYRATGSGTAYFFQDGGVTTGQWVKSDRKLQFTFTDAAGTPIKLNAGQSWVTFVDSPSDVSYR